MYHNADPKPSPSPKKKRKPLRRTAIKKTFTRKQIFRFITPKKKPRKPTGELNLFKKIYDKLDGKSQLTGNWLRFNVCNFVHVLSKGAAPNMRLHEDNIVHAEFEFHFMYDNASKERTLKSYPQAIWIYKLKEKIKGRHERLSSKNQRP